MSAPNWSLPESWLAEADGQRRVAQHLRAEIAMYSAEIIARRTAGDQPKDLAALELSKWHAIEKASAIERHLRGIT